MLVLSCLKKMIFGKATLLLMAVQTVRTRKFSAFSAEIRNYKINNFVWVGRDLQRSSGPPPLLWAGTSFTGSSNLTFNISSDGHPLLWASCSSPHTSYPKICLSLACLDFWYSSLLNHGLWEHLVVSLGSRTVSCGTLVWNSFFSPKELRQLMSGLHQTSDTGWGLFALLVSFYWTGASNFFFFYFIPMVKESSLLPDHQTISM